MQLAWSRPLPVPALGLSLAREPGTLLLRDELNHLSRFDRKGQLEHRLRAPASLIGSRIADDGKTVAAIGRRGQVWLLTLDFVPIWERAVPRKPLALALDVLGKRLAVSDEAGGLTLFDHGGRQIWHVSTAKPLLHLAFVPEAPFLIGCAEYGLVTAIDQHGETTWRDGLVAHVGSLAINGDGSRIVLACYTNGLNCYAVTEPKRLPLPRAAPSRLVAMDYVGQTLLTTGLANELVSRGPQGELIDVLLLPANVVALSVDALGTSAVVVLADGTLGGIQLASE